MMEPLEYPVQCKDVNQRFMVINTRQINASIIVNFFDIPRRKQAEAEREKLQGQLYQSQKLEAVGVLAGRIQTIRPETKILFMSGYTADMIAHQGALDRNINFIQKPFFLKGIAAKLRKIVD